MPKGFDPDLVRKRLEGLSCQHSKAFAALCCERLLPNYGVFTKMTGWGDPELLRQSLDAIWNSISGSDFNRDLRELETLCCNVMPDTEEFSILEASQALDASVAICETLQLCYDGDMEHAINVASLARDTVDMFIQERDDLDPSDPALEERILSDPLMVKELTCQLKDLSTLIGMGSFDREAVQALRRMYEGRSNIRF